MAQDTLKITILDDGSVKVETDRISPANHLSADALVTLLGQLMGGDVSIDQKRPGHTHQAQHKTQTQGGG
jgi:hypothetical protein